MSNDPTNGITFVETGEMCPTCDIENIINVDYREVVKILKGEADANLPLIHCKECGNRLAPCSMCTDAINDGIIAEEERNCFDCPITKYWNAKFGEDKHGEDDMAEEKKTPSFDEIQKSFFEKCQLHQKRYPDWMPCPHCEYECLGSNWRGECNGDLDSQGSCERHYIYEVATGARDINKPLWNPPTTPEWFKVGARLWRKSYNDWYTITDLTPAGVHEDGSPLFAVDMVASDGSEDEATLTAFAFTTEAPFSESFRQLIGKRAFHKEFEVLVDIIEYDYEDNNVHLSYTDKHGISNSVWEEFHEENFEAVKVPSWFKVGQWIGATKDCRAIGEIVGVNGDIIEVDWIVNGEPIGEQFDVTCANQVLSFVPVKFRPYDYKEAKGLLGKVMEHTEMIAGRPSHYLAFIYRVEHHEHDGELLINLFHFKSWAGYNATIDGLPIGVPVVDEELLSNP